MRSALSEGDMPSKTAECEVLHRFGVGPVFRKTAPQWPCCRPVPRLSPRDDNPKDFADKFRDLPIVGPVFANPLSAVVLGVAAFFGYSSLSQVQGHQTIHATIQAIDAPRTCCSATGSAQGALGGRKRSSIESTPGAPCCGLIYTDIGMVEPPDSYGVLDGRVTLPSREEIWDRLRAGCRQLLYFRGSGERLRESPSELDNCVGKTVRPGSDQKPKILINAYSADDCAGGGGDGVGALDPV